MEPKITLSAGANTGFLMNASKDAMLASTVTLGGQIESDKGYFAKANAGAGSLIFGEVEAGKKFRFGDSRFGAATSVGGQYAQATRTRDYYSNVFEEGANSPTWKSNDTRGYANAKLTYNAPAFRAGIGVQAGVKTATQPSLDGIQLANVGTFKGTEYAGRTTKTYVTPTIEIEAGKTLCGNLNISTEGVFLGAKYNCDLTKIFNR